jgi:hypothetical protein
MTEQDRQEPQTYAYVAPLTRCAGTWLAEPPDQAEQQRIDDAARQLREQRQVAVAFYNDPAAARAYSLELFSKPDFAPLHLNDAVIERILAAVGEPPIVATTDDPAFATYMRQAALHGASSRARRDLARQLRRFLPRYVAAGDWKPAVAIDHNAFRTALGKEASPFLVQMTFGGLLRWYEQHGD